MSVALQQSMSAKHSIKRIPFPDLYDLPSQLANTAGVFKKSLTEHAFLHMIRDVAINHYGSMYANDQSDFIAEVANTDDSLVRRRKTIYGGALSYQTTQYNVGVYNPDRISIDIYEKMRRHAQIALSLAVIKKPIEHVNFLVDCDSQEVKALVTWNLNNIYSTLVRDLLLSIDFGVSFNEKVWVKIPSLIIKTRNTDGKLKVVYKGETLALKTFVIHPTTITLLLDKNGELIGIKQTPITGGFSTVTVKRRKLVIKVNDMEFGNWWGNPRLKSAYTWWFWSEVVLQFMIKYLERKSSPATIVEAPPGFTTDRNGQMVNNFDLALQIGASLTSHAIGVLPRELDNNGKSRWDIHYLMDEQRLFAFIEVLSYLNKMISRSLWVLDSVTSDQGDGTSFAAADSRTDIHLVIEEALIRELEQVLNADVVPDIVKYNFPPERRATCTVTIEKLTITRKLMLKEIVMKSLGVINQFARDGGLFKILPDLPSILKLLEIPTARIEDLVDFENWKPAENNDSTDTPADDDVTQEEKVKENNKDKKRVLRPKQVKRKKTAA